MGRANNKPHKVMIKVEHGYPIIGVAYFFPGDPDIEGTIPTVVIKDAMSNAVFVHLTPAVEFMASASSIR